MTGVSPASKRLSMSGTRTAAISPTWPRPPAAGRAVSRPPSTPAKPIASIPARRSAATTSRLEGPARTISATSATSGGVTRLPSRFSTRSPSRRDRALTASPPPCTTTTGSTTLRAAAQAASHAGRSNSLPPNFTTRTGSIRPWTRRDSACEPRRLRQPEHDVHVLDRLARGAFHEVVDRRDHGEPRPAHVGNARDADRDPVPVHDVPERRQRTGGNGNARLPVVRRLVNLLGRAAVEGPRERDVDGLEDAALHGQEMRREDEVTAEAALASQGRSKLRKVAVLVPHRVRPEVLRHLAEQELAPGSAAGAGDAGCGADHDLPRRVDQLPPREGDEGEKRRGRVAARIGHELGDRDARPRPPGEAVHRRRRQPEVGRQIDGPPPRPPPPLDAAAGHPLRPGAKSGFEAPNARVVGRDQPMPFDDLPRRRFGRRKAD